MYQILSGPGRVFFWCTWALCVELTFLASNDVLQSALSPGEERVIWADLILPLRYVNFAILLRVISLCIVHAPGVFTRKTEVSMLN